MPVLATVSDVRGSEPHKGPHAVEILVDEFIGSDLGGTCVGT